MTGHRNGRAAALSLELRWDHQRPLPSRWVIPEGRRTRGAPANDPAAPFDFSAAMARLCADVAARSEAFRHVHMPRVLVTFTPSRNRSRYGLQARVTPLRFRNGALTRRHGAVEYQVQRYFVDDREMLYLLTFCLPRFLDQSFDEKLVTVFHELFHVNPAFDGDLRRHPGRYAMHSHSKARYDTRMADLARDYIDDHPEPELFAFLRSGYRELWDRHDGPSCSRLAGPRPAQRPAIRNSVQGREVMVDLRLV